MPHEPQRPFGGQFADPSATVIVSPGCELTITELVAVSRGDSLGEHARVELAGDWRRRCQRSADYVQQAVAATMGRSPDELAALARQRLGDKAPTDASTLATRAQIYGVTTGFGYFKSRPLTSQESASQMQVNILRSHATGVGAPFPTEVVRAMMLLRLRTFVEGYSGIRPQVLEMLVEMLNRRVHPWVPEQGSVGSSGDLCPLAHLALTLLGEGAAWLDDRAGQPGYAWTGAAGSSAAGEAWDVRSDRRCAPKPAAQVLAEAGLSDRVLKDLCPKEGLALTNGTSATTAVAALATYDAALLYGTANLAAACSLQALRGFSRALDPKVHALRRHRGQVHSAEQILRFADGGQLLNCCDDVQDSYSLRCAPAVHGASFAAIEHVWSIVEGEINAVTDNPLFFDAASDGSPCDQYSACIWDSYAAGNFHGEPVGMAADYLKIAVAELGSISERRVQSLLDEHHSRGLPANLWSERNTAGLNSGLMIAQYAAAALVSENKVLCHPASVDSIPTSSNIEDHVAMATIAARHARRVIENARNVLAIELLTSLQGLEIRLTKLGGGEEVLSPPVRRIRALIRRGDRVTPPVPALGERDALLWPGIAAIQARIASGEILRVAIKSAGPETPPK